MGDIVFGKPAIVYPPHEAPQTHKKWPSWALRAQNLVLGHTTCSMRSPLENCAWATLGRFDNIVLTYRHTFNEYCHGSFSFLINYYGFSLPYDCYVSEIKIAPSHAQSCPWEQPD